MVETMKLFKDMPECRKKLQDHFRFDENGISDNGTFEAYGILLEAEKKLKDFIDENERLKAELEAQKAVSERFKKLYVDEVVNKALKESENDQAEV